MGTKVCTNGPGHMTKMAATLIYGKKPLKIFYSRTKVDDLGTHLSTSFSQKSLGCLMDYSLDCLGHLTKLAATPIYGKRKFVLL